MTIPNRKFGVEIEAKGISIDRAVDAINEAGIECRYEHYGHSRPVTWKIVTDASVDHGYEVVSPVLVGEEGIQQVRTVAKALSGAGGRVDRQCGLHVHVSAAGFTREDLFSVVARYRRFENEIDQFMPRSRRGNNNGHCVSLADFVSEDVLFQRITSADFGTTRDVARLLWDRYIKLNVQSYLRQGTVEFRQHSGTINANKIENWIRFCVNFMEQSKITTYPAVQQQFGIQQQHNSDASENTLSRRHRKLKLLLCSLRDNGTTGLSAEELADITGYRRSTIAVTISHLRNEWDCTIVLKSNGRYVLENVPALAEEWFGMNGASSSANHPVNQETASTSEHIPNPVRLNGGGCIVTIAGRMVGESRQDFRERCILAVLSQLGRPATDIYLDTVLANAGGYNPSSIPAVIGRLRQRYDYPILRRRATANCPGGYYFGMMSVMEIRRIHEWAVNPGRFIDQNTLNTLNIHGREGLRLRPGAATERHRSGAPANQHTSNDHPTHTIAHMIVYGFNGDSWDRGLEHDVRNFYQERAQELAA